MKRRIAYKVANAIALGTSHHNPETRRRALATVNRDLSHGRLDGVLMSHRLGVIKIGEWYRVNIAEPMMKAGAAISEAMGTMAIQLRRMMDGLARDLSRVKIPPVTAGFVPMSRPAPGGSVDLSRPVPPAIDGSLISDEEAPFVTMNEAAGVLGVHATTIGRRLKKGAIEGHQVDGVWMITDPAVVALVREI